MVEPNPERNRRQRKLVRPHGNPHPRRAGILGLPPAACAVAAPGLLLTDARATGSRPWYHGLGACHNRREVSALFIWLWIAGGAPAAVLGEVVQAENPRIARVGRIAFALLLGVDLLVAAVFFSVGADAPTAHMTRSLWWVTIILGGIPLALVSGLAVRRGYAGHRLVLLVATLMTAVLYLAFPLGFTPVTQPRLGGFGLFAHEHRVLGIAILFIPSLILLANELRWKQDEAPGPELGRASIRSRIRVIPRRSLIGVGVLLLALIWTAGTDNAGLLLGIGVFVVGAALFAWWRQRATTRSVLEDLRPPEES
jgi:hypothetical protein